MARLKSWSYSTHQQMARCPKRVEYAKIQKLPDPSGPQADRGTAVHAAFEGYARGEIHALPAAFSRWQPMLDHLLETADDVIPELDLAFTRRWKKTTWERGTIRMKIDLAAVSGDDITSIDYKTGRIYPEHEEQLEIYALGLFRTYPWAQRIYAADWYLDQGDATLERIYERSQLDDMHEKWSLRIRKDLSRKDFPARRNVFCKYCPFNSRKGGPCTEGA